MEQCPADRKQNRTFLCVVGKFAGNREKGETSNDIYIYNCKEGMVYFVLMIWIRK
jgi:hypothetical protein